ncbi:MAG: hypothetical protein B7C24_13325 [Bacteroidetes bacterium 4572_77]|nr:MAG: hypothetical protein B7C24_13325 [Bacteroidetes bacterium 4572_77]
MLGKNYRYRIVVYEHPESCLSTVFKAITEKGFRLTVVSSFTELQNTLQKNDDLLLLLDYNHPIINAKQLILHLETRIKKLPPSLVVLKDNNTHEMASLTKLGVKDFIVQTRDLANSIIFRLQVISEVLQQEKWEKEKSDIYHKEFFQFLDVIQDYVFVRKMNGHLLAVNNSCLNKLKYNLEEIQELEPYELIAPIEIENYKKHIKLLNKNETHYFKTILYSKDRENVPVEMSTKITPYSNEDIIVNIARDITKLEELENGTKKEYQARNKHLQSINMEIEENRKALKIALQEAENAEQLKNKFLANMSHELRTPMNAIVGFSQLLEDADAEDIPEFVRIINQNSELLLQLINDLLDIAKIESDLVRMNTKEESIPDMLSELHEIYQAERKRLHKTHISINYNKVERDICFLETDRQRLMQGLKNLLNNALKFTEEGSIEFGCIEDDDYVKFYVKDTGIGIPLSAQHEIFERFRQIDEESNPDGTGIGLSISRSLIRLLGGDIRLESDVNQGSIFYIYHPKKQRQNNIVQPIQKNIVVLSIEEHNENDSLLKYVLEDLNINIFKARNGKDVLEICKTREIDLVLLDTPNVKIGQRATKEILRYKPHLPIVVQTAFSGNGEDKSLLQAGCTEVIAKPINLTLLRRTIAKYI